MNENIITDPYAEAADLIARLQAVGRQADAEVLQDAIDSGSTGTEIFMALRWHLEDLLKKGLPDDLRKRAARLEAFLAAALR
ncbi:MAG: hypothetical protein EXR76_15715 [Myxococcales bacterium]|nr:hypothetical protein [Myxococcales bacterium]